MSTIDRSIDFSLWSDELRGVVRRRLRECGGVALITLAVMMMVALATWSVQDPSLSNATSTPARNLLGSPGAIAADLSKLADVKYEGRKAIVCLVGENIRNTPGIAAKVFNAIADVNIQMISQGASEINISFVIDEPDVPKVVSKLHQVFFSEVDPEVFA